MFFSIEDPKAASAVGSGDVVPARKLKGRDALKVRWDQIKGSTVGNLTWKDLEPFQVFGHLLDAAWKREVQKKQTELGKEVAKRHRSGKKDAARPAKKAKVSHADEEGEKAARALLGQ